MFGRRRTENPRDRGGRPTDRALLVEEMRRAKRRGEAVDALERADLYLADHPEDEEVKEARERLGDREERRFFLKYYAPAALVAFLALGLHSERWAISAVAAAVVALPGGLTAWVIVRILTFLKSPP